MTDRHVLGKRLNAPSSASAAEIKTGTVTDKYTAPDQLLSAFGFSAAFTSAAQTITAAGNLSIAHGLGRRPIWCIVLLKCLTADNGFSVGDYQFQTAAVGAQSQNNRGAMVSPDTTNLYVRYGSDATYVFNGMNKTTGVGVGLTNANWEAYFVVLA